MSEQKYEVLTSPRLACIPRLRHYLETPAPLTDAEMNALRQPAPSVYGESPAARPSIQAPPLLDEAYRAAWGRRLDRENRAERGRTLANMAAYGKDAMARWFPRGTAEYLNACFPKSVA